MKPLAYIDIESTGPNPATDAIVTLAILSPDRGDFEWKVKPWKPIPPEATAIHGITNEQVADLPPFKFYAQQIHDKVAGYHLVGFNHRQFDVPLLWEEFHRVDIGWDLSDTLLIDVGVLFKKREERTLSAAMQFYCGKPHDGAHGAIEDCKATQAVFHAQLARYKDLHGMDTAALAKASEFDGPKPLTFDGKIVEGPDGEPMYNFGSKKGTSVFADTGFAYWMLGKDFPEQTKIVLRKLLDFRNPRSASTKDSDLFSKR